MTLEDAIYSNIINWPDLYYKANLKLSRLTVLSHYFLTLGTGIELARTKDPKRSGYFIERESKYDPPYGAVKVPEEAKGKIRKGVRMYRVYPVDTKSSSEIYFVKSLNGESLPIFEDENSPVTYPEIYSKVKGKRAEFCVEFYPEKEHFDWSPYPFCFYYLPFVEINPHYDKYDYQTISEMTVAELRESKSLIREDWVAGIVEIYEHTLRWFKSNKFFKDRYYNWVIEENQPFIAKFNAAKGGGNLEKFCQDYGIPVSDYETWKDFACVCIVQNRARYIRDCQKIIEAFS